MQENSYICSLRPEKWLQDRFLAILVRIGKPQRNCVSFYLGIARKGGGGGRGVSTLARMVWGNFLEKNLPRSNDHLLGFGGV